MTFYPVFLLRLRYSEGEETGLLFEKRGKNRKIS